MENEQSRERLVSEMKRNQKGNRMMQAENLKEELIDTRRRAFMTEEETNRKLSGVGARVRSNLELDEEYSGNHLIDTGKMLELVEIIDQDSSMMSDEKRLSALLMKMYYRDMADIEKEAERGVTDGDRLAASGYGFDLQMQLSALTAVDKNYHELYIKGIIDKKQFEGIPK